MGLSTSERGNKTYLSILQGKFALKVTPGTEGAVTRVNKTGETVYERLYDHLDGQIVDFNINDGNYGKELRLIIESGLDKFNLSIPVESKYFDSFALRLGNINLNKEVKISPYAFSVFEDGKEKKKVGMNFYQNGQKIEYFYTKDDPKDKPMPPKGKNGAQLEDSKWKIFKLQERDWLCDMITEKASSLNRPAPKAEVDGNDVMFPKKAQGKSESTIGDLPF